MVPDFIYDKDWQKASFLIPEDQTLRYEMHLRYQTWLRMGSTCMSFDEASNKGVREGARRALRARIAAIEAYDTVILSTK